MNKRQRRLLEVVAINDITPHLRRITFAGDELIDFPENAAGSYIKLVFNPDTDEQSVRTYTIRQQRQDAFDVDFVLHGDSGVASAWANKTRIGEKLHIGGPGKGQMINFEADWYFLVGDMTALPAISVNLEQLPSNAKGYVVIQIEAEEDKQTLIMPEQMQLIWVVEPLGQHEKLLQTAKAQVWLEGSVATWAASEFDGMKALRQYFKQEMLLSKSHCYISSYWKNGIAEDEHKKVKKTDSELNAE